MAKVDDKQYQALLRAVRKMREVLLFHEQRLKETDLYQPLDLTQLEADLLRFQQEYTDKEKALRQAQQEFAARIKQARLQLLQQAQLIRKVLGTSSKEYNLYGIAYVRQMRKPREQKNASL